MNTQQKLIEYVQSMLHALGDDDLVTPDTSLVISGRLQSLDIVELAAWMEKSFHLNFARDGFNQYEFDTINSMKAMIARYEGLS